MEEIQDPKIILTEIIRKANLKRPKAHGQIDGPILNENIPLRDIHKLLSHLYATCEALKTICLSSDQKVAFDLNYLKVLSEINKPSGEN
jgi:hypothetical protein